MEVKNYSVSFGSRQLSTNINVSFSSNKMNIIMGANGAGKSTLLDFIAGIGPEGAVGEKVGIPSYQKIAYQLQQVHFFPTLTVAQTVAFYSQLTTNQSNSKTYENAKNVRNNLLSPIWNTKMGQLSGGERQIVLTYGQCLLDKEVYIFDEPTSGVDEKNAPVVLSMINDLVINDHKIVIMTSHHSDQLKQFDLNLIAL
ncbi:ATP-binding cassette domain-containing protein [Leuconostoc falkenbergense]|jgi:ABC-2 type transport system ATP-binding protein|uniref:ATP-binding cassette domain-containing protein n=1 Tax=Leuconostoc falkenbergense TaxID=2766470 RepID=A0ABT7S0M6_9LACO|nr:ATP-binding cassette domain-containing protein [Leuconostoc falkenbergense]RDG19102.1 cobalt ABC transporter ATP-binding protein [Leuconostoc pseudomesenteroides]MCT4390677.1 ATP-binding cassette domain-containing protein [Leuconostoc falkenbergense]MCT4410738.1 ATP-binding cassette domain-containing protein [Leuconostoc falkenbergense]MDM7647107.1 ATP-binding cassette domain-containing protein [Leuconostoc falkenbergense]MDV3544753.1 ATP-binding cassette domain-containing protein [Leuconos